MNWFKFFDSSLGQYMRKAACPLGGVESSNPCCWRGERLHHHGGDVCCVFVLLWMDSWHLKLNVCKKWYKNNLKMRLTALLSAEPYPMVQKMGQHPSTCSPPPLLPPLKHLPDYSANYRVDCGVESSNGGHLRARPCPLLYFLMGYASAPQTKEQAAASVNLPPGACNGLTVSHCALIWGHGGCCHGKRWQSCWRVGQWRLILVVVCFVFLCFMLCSSCLLATGVVENWYWQKQNCQLLCNHNIKSKTKPPQCNYMSFKEMVHGKMTAPHIDMNLIVWGQIKCMKMVLRKASFS